MSNQTRPQLAPEVLDQPLTQSAGTKANTNKTDKDVNQRSFAADITVEGSAAVREPLPKPVARPIVEVHPGAELPIAAVGREPLPKPVARPIVEVSPGVEQQNAAAGREPLPKPTARPIVEVSPSAELPIAAAGREPLPKPVARPIVEVAPPGVEQHNEGANNNRR